MYQLIPMILIILVVDVASTYGMHLTFEFNSMYIVYMAVNSVYVVIQFLLKVLISHVGDSTTSEAEKVKILLAKSANSLSVNSPSRLILNDILIQFDTRNLNLQNVFFTIDWKVLLAVS